MKQKEEKKTKNRKLSILLLQFAIVIGCIVIFYILMTPKDRVKDTTYSYSKLEEVKEYEIEGEYITRVRPLTEYEVFKETAEYTLNNNQEGKKYTVKVYSNSNKTQEVAEGYIKSGMVLEGISNGNSTANGTVEYTIGVIGDFTKDGDITIAELTRIIKGVIGLNDWRFTEEDKLIADFNGDKEVNVVDIEECINYIVYGRLTLENGTKLKATDEYGITWNYTYKNGEATDVHYESGELKETVNIPASLDGYPVVSLYNSSLRRNSVHYSSTYTNNLFAKSEYERNTTIKEIIIQNNVREIGSYAFSDCTSLTSIEIPEGVTSIENSAFFSCTSLTSIEIIEGATSIGNGAFENCTSLISIEIPDSVTSIGDSAFHNCTSLTSVEIPDSVRSIGYEVFYDTEWYNKQPDGVVYAGKIAYKYKGTMTENAVIELKEGTKCIGNGAFSSCTGLTSIKIPSSVTSIGGMAFSYCTSLTSIEMPDSVTSIGARAFHSCTGLTEMNMPDNVKSVGHEAFYDTEWYNKQPDGVVYAGKIAYKYKGAMTENAIELKEGTKCIGNDAFSSCTGLTSIKIPSSVTSIGDSAFSNCSSLTSIEMPDSVTSIGNNAFSGCTSLTSIKIPSSVTSIGDSAFRNCTSLTSIEIPEGVTSIGNMAFSYCTRLTSIKIPEGVKRIGTGAFDNCISLENIVIWKNIDELGYRMFNGWTSSQTINVEANEIPEGWERDWDYGCNAKIVYGYIGD